MVLLRTFFVMAAFLFVASGCTKKSEPKSEGGETPNNEAAFALGESSPVPSASQFPCKLIQTRVKCENSDPDPLDDDDTATCHVVEVGPPSATTCDKQKPGVCTFKNVAYTCNAECKLTYQGNPVPGGEGGHKCSNVPGSGY